MIFHTQANERMNTRMCTHTYIWPLQYYTSTKNVECRRWREKTNVWVLENMKPEWTLASRVAQAALLWTCGERGTRNGEWWDVRGDEWEEKARKAKNNVNNLEGPFINSMRWDARDGAKSRSATAVVARGGTWLDVTRYCYIHTRII